MNKIEESFIRQLVRSQNWSTIENLGRELVEKIKNENVITDTEWETLKNAIMKEGRIEGIKLILSELFLIGSKNE